MNFWLIADTHFNHHFLVNSGLRLAEYDNKLWWSLYDMPKSDILYHLGDVSIGDDDFVHAHLNMFCLAKRRILIRGNHDQKSYKWYLERGWSAVSDGEIIKRYGKTILLTHGPVIIPDWIDLNIHGHLHSGQHRIGIEDEKHILVSCELDGYKPVTLESVVNR